MAEWRPTGLVNPNSSEFRYGKAYGRAKDWEDTVDTVLAGIWRMAKDSPTGTFTFDTQREQSFAGTLTVGTQLEVFKQTAVTIDQGEGD